MILQELLEPSQRFCIAAILGLARSARQGHVLGVNQDGENVGIPRQWGDSAGVTVRG